MRSSSGKSVSNVSVVVENKTTGDSKASGAAMGLPASTDYPPEAGGTSDTLQYPAEAGGSVMGAGGDYASETGYGANSAYPPQAGYASGSDSSGPPV